MQVVTFTVTSVSIGFCSVFLNMWIRNHLIALAVGIPTCLLVSSIIEKLVHLISREKAVSSKLVADLNLLEINKTVNKGDYNIKIRKN